MNMTKLIFLIALCCLTSSCHQNSKSSKDNALLTLEDSLQSKISSQIDTTAIDVVKVSPDKYRILLENEYVRVVEYSIKPGEKDNPHTHPRKTSYILSGGTLRVYPENEKAFDYEEVEGVTEWADKTAKHYVENIGKTTITILLTEIK